MTALTVCPLGLCTFEEVCPNAPCAGCMHRLGEHLLGEVEVLRQQAEVANMRGDLHAYDKLNNTLWRVSHLIHVRMCRLEEKGETSRSVQGTRPESENRHYVEMIGEGPGAEEAHRQVTTTILDPQVKETS